MDGDNIVGRVLPFSTHAVGRPPRPAGILALPHAHLRISDSISNLPLRFFLHHSSTLAAPPPPVLLARRRPQRRGRRKKKARDPPPPRLGTENAVGTLLPLVPLLFFVKMQLPKNPLFQGYRLGSGALTDIHVPFPTPCPRARAEPGPTLSTHDNPRIPIERWNSKSGAVYFDTGWPTSCQRGLAAGKIYRGVKKIEVHPPAASLLTRGIRNRKNGPSDPNER